MAGAAALLLALTAAPAFGHGGITLTSASGDGVTAQLTGGTLPGDQTQDGRVRIDYTVAIRDGGQPVTDARVKLAIDRGDRIERRSAKLVDGDYEVLVDPEEEEDWRQWPTRVTVERPGVSVLSAVYEPADASAPSWLPFLGVLLVPLMVFAGSRLVRRTREAPEG